MAHFYETYIQIVCLGLAVFSVAIAWSGGRRACLPAPQIALVAATMALFLGGWYTLAVPFAQAGHFNVPVTPSDPPIVLMFLFGGAFLFFALAWWTSGGRKVAKATPLSLIAAFQIPRVIGGVFLIGWLAGDLPALFAIPAGVGDILAGVAGWQASVALAQARPDAHHLLKRATWIGIADFFIAVALGIMTSEGFAHLFAHEAPNIINDYPFAMFPAFIVPVFLGFHVIALARLRREQRRETPSSHVKSA